jgi:hypothetical protein
MAAFACICFLVGVVLGLRFKVLILVPTIGFSVVAVAANGIVIGESLSCGGLRWSWSWPQRRFSWATSVGPSRGCSSARPAPRSDRRRVSTSRSRMRPAES